MIDEGNGQMHRQADTREAPATAGERGRRLGGRSGQETNEIAMECGNPQTGERTKRPQRRGEWQLLCRDGHISLRPRECGNYSREE